MKVTYTLLTNIFRLSALLVKNFGTMNASPRRVHISILSASESLGDVIIKTESSIELVTDLEPDNQISQYEPSLSEVLVK